MDFTPECVKRALCHPAFGVRPPEAQIPEDLQGTEAGNLFSELVRMNEGELHRLRKTAVVAALKTVDNALVQQMATRVSLRFPRLLIAETVTDFIYGMPVAVMGELLGVSVTEQDSLVSDVLDFTRCIAPGGTSRQRRAGIEAASRLTCRLRRLCETPGPLLIALQRAFNEQGIGEPRTVIANAAGLLFQACEGTAGLIGQSLLLARQQPLAGQALIHTTVLAHTPPIRNTRRFAQTDTQFEGGPFRKGEPLVLPLAQGNAFGYGVHACPGEAWATVIAAVAMEHLQGVAGINDLLKHYRWRDSVNARVPEFFTSDTKDKPDACCHL